MDPKLHASEPSRSIVRENVKAWIRHFMAMMERRLGERVTHEAFADAINLDRVTITNILNDRREAGLQVLYKIHHYLGKDEGVTMESMIYTKPPKAAAAPAGVPAKAGNRARHG